MQIDPEVRQPEAAIAPAPKRRFPWWVLVVVGAAGVYLLAFLGLLPLNLPGVPQAHGEGQAQPTYTLDLGDFTVNLADSGYRRYLRTSITLEYRGQVAAEEFTAKQYRLQDAVNQVLRHKTTEDTSVDNTEALREELRTALNAILKENTVTGVYFRTFLIQ